MSDRNVYRIYDTSTKEYWNSNKEKTIWMKAASAKNAWNVAREWRTDPFNKQSRFVIHEFELTLLERK